jgi:hypothetical protein
MMTLTLAALLLGIRPIQDPSLEQPISLAASGAAASAVVERVATATRLKLEVSAEVASEVLAVEATNVKVGDLLERIATATGASWKLDGDKRRLTRTAEQTRDEARAALDRRSRAIQAGLDALAPEAGLYRPLAPEEAINAAVAAKMALDELLDRIQKGGDDAPIKQKVIELGNKTSAGRMLLRAARAVGAETLAAIPPGRRVVFALHPTAQQRAFPAAFDAGIQAFLIDHARWLDALKRVEPSKVHMEGGPDLYGRDPVSSVGELHLVASRLHVGDGLELNMAVGSATGAMLVEAQATISPQAAQGSAIGSDGRIDLSERARGFLGAWDACRSAAGQPVAEEWFAAWSKPNTEEPLGFVAGELLRGLSRARGANLVAVLPDRAFLPSMAVARATPITTAGLERSLPAWGMESRQEGGWIIASPTNAPEDRGLRVDRRALAALLQTAVSKKQAFLVDLGAYALKRPPSLAGPGLDSLWLGLFSARIDNAGTASGLISYEAPMLRFFGSVAPAQQRSLVAGAELPIANLSAGAMAALGDMVFHSANGPSVGKVPNPFAAPVRAGRSLLNERTKALANGIPKDGVVTLKLTQVDAFQTVSSKSGAARILAGNDLISMLVTSQMDARKGKAPGFDRFRPASMTSYAFTFHLKPEVSLAKALAEARVNRSSALLTYDQLPEGLRSQVEQVVSNSSSFGGSRFGVPGGGGRGNPPPTARG